MSETDRPGSGSGWTDRQRRFVDEYFIDLNATRAAARAGYSAESAGRRARKLMKLPHVKEEIQRRRDADGQRYAYLREQIISARAHIAFANPFDLVPPDERPAYWAELDPELKQAVKEIITTEYHDRHGRPVRRHGFKLWSKNEALSALEKITGMTTERVEHRLAFDPNRARQEMEELLTSLFPANAYDGPDPGDAWAEERPRPATQLHRADFGRIPAAPDWPSHVNRGDKD